MSGVLQLLPAVGPCGGNPDCVVQPFDGTATPGIPVGLLLLAALVVLLGLALLRVQRREARDPDPERREDDTDGTR